MAKSGLGPAHRIAGPGSPLRPCIAIAMERDAAHAGPRAELLEMTRAIFRSHQPQSWEEWTGLWQLVQKRL